MTDADIEKAAGQYTHPVKDYHRKNWEQMAFKAGVDWAKAFMDVEKKPFFEVMDEIDKIVEQANASD